MKWLYLAGLYLLLQACGGGDAPELASEPSPTAAAACSIADQRQSLRTYMTDQYYWYSQLAAPDESAGNIDGYFHSMLAKPADRYSFIETTAAHNALFVEGHRTGYGYSLVWADAAQTVLRVRYVEPLSPVAAAGLRRGDTVLAIDDLSPAQIATGLLPVVNTAGVQRHFIIRNSDGVQQAIDVQSADFALAPVTTTATLDATRSGAPVKVGYLAYSQFVSYSSNDLKQAFTGFAADGISELILDLRYNGGGSVGVARDLASMVSPRAAGELFAYLRFNDKQAAKTLQVRFSGADLPLTPAQAGGLDRVFVITSGATASASELVINGLRPFVKVVLVGETTYGKPYGFVPRENCGITYNAVQFEALNALGVGNYTTGFTPDCAVSDDFDRQLGDPAERRIRTALDYIATGSCASGPLRQAAPRATAPAQVFGETGANGMFVE
jgi:carboxyl-terminal processing protease